MLQEHIDPHPAGTTYRLTQRDAALEWMCKQYGQHLASLAQDLGGWDCVGHAEGTYQSRVTIEVLEPPARGKP